MEPQKTLHPRMPAQQARQSINSKQTRPLEKRSSRPHQQKTLIGKNHHKTYLR